jgi:hypothetical protein
VSVVIGLGVGSWTAGWGVGEIGRHVGAWEVGPVKWALVGLLVGADTGCLVGGGVGVCEVVMTGRGVGAVGCLPPVGAVGGSVDEGTGWRVGAAVVPFAGRLLPDGAVGDLKSTEVGEAVLGEVGSIVGPLPSNQGRGGSASSVGAGEGPSPPAPTGMLFGLVLGAQDGASTASIID